MTRAMAVAAAVAAAGAAWAQTETDAAMEHRLEIQRIPVLEFNNATMQEVAEYLADATGLNFWVDPEAEGAEPVTIRMEDVPVRSTLRFILTPRQLIYRVVDGVVHIEPKTHEPTVLRLYDVRDITFPLTMFPGEDITIGGSVGPPAPEEETTSDITPEDIQELIKAHCGGDSWDTNPNVSISTLEAGGVMVRQTTEVQRQIERLLDMLRG